MGGAPNLETVFRKIVKNLLQYLYETNNSMYKLFGHFFLFYYFFSSAEFSGVLPLPLAMPMFLMLRVMVKFWQYLKWVARAGLLGGRPLIGESSLVRLRWNKFLRVKFTFVIFSIVLQRVFIYILHCHSFNYPANYFAVSRLAVLIFKFVC